MPLNKNTLCILGTRGIPAKHGGFETFAEELSAQLSSDNWEVRVYCQGDKWQPIRSSYHGKVCLVTVPSLVGGPLGTIFYDLICVIHTSAKNSTKLVLGYNSAILLVLLRILRRKIVINMDGMEWKRGKWGPIARLWLKANELCAVRLATHLVADHPEIASLLADRHDLKEKKITMIPYGARKVFSSSLNQEHVLGYCLQRYCLVVARPEPENMILEIVRSFSDSDVDGQLLILGDYDFTGNPYHRKIFRAADSRVQFLGAVYEQELLDALRARALFYVHGHTVGGTNPSLIEALGAGCAILAHDNKFNRWVAADSALYFRNELECQALIDKLFNNDALREELQAKSSAIFASRFLWEVIINQYKVVLEDLER